jgi:hypothetical protein
MHEAFETIALVNLLSGHAKVSLKSEITKIVSRLYLDYLMRD